MMAGFITDQQWTRYEREGYLRLDRLLDERELPALRQRLEEIMLGQARLNYDRMLMQLDSDSGRYEDIGPQTKGFKGATLNYRKIQELEFDPLFLAYMQRPIFREICAQVYGPQTPVAAFRAMFMNKPARKGSFLPWHQDRWTFLDRDPLVTIWTALDPATIGNGCLQIIPGSHRAGVINPSNPNGFLTPEQAQQRAAPDQVMHLELKPGEVALFHNFTLHASDVNRTEIPRRAFSVCYMDARTVARHGGNFSVIFGEGALTPDQLARRGVV